MYRRGNIFWGVLLILLAVLLLFKQMGILIGDIFAFFWPFVIIAIGAWLIFGFFSRRQPIQGEQVTIPLEGASSAYIKFNHGAGRLNISSGASTGEILNGSFSGGLEHKSHLVNGRLEIKLRSSSQFWAWGPGQTLDWEVRLNPEIPLSLKIDSGASASLLDLGDLKVTDLDVDTGASSTEIRLPSSAGNTRVDIHTGASSLKLHVPPAVAARIQIKSGLASINIDPNRFPRLEGGIYQSPDYSTSTNRADITVDTGVGSVEVN